MNHILRLFMKKLLIFLAFGFSVNGMETIAQGKMLSILRPALESKPIQKMATELNLSGQALTNLNKLKAVENKATIVSIDLSNNLLTTLPAGAFEGFDNIQFIVLSNNRIESVDAHAFDGLLFLEEITIIDNPIKSLADDLFNCFELPTIISKVDEED